MMVAMMGAAAIVVGAIGVLAFQTWWVLIVAVLAHAIASVFVLGYVGKTLNENTDKPDPVTEARLEEEGSR
jgi:membrane protein implicated in regulation of membrane protease activity